MKPIHSLPSSIVILLLTICTTNPVCVVSCDAASPNIVLIVADDLGYGDLACYGSRQNKTPNIDALAKQGLRFTDFHSAGSMCTPTRAAMLTGQYQQRFGRRFDGPLSGLTDRHTGLPQKSVTIAEILKQKGYATACFGKWHLGYQPGWLPTSHGFDVFRGLASGDGDHHTQIDRSGNEDWWHNNQIEMTKGYTADLLTEYSIDFIEQHNSKPFFLYVPHLAVHFPWQGPNDPAHRVAGKSYQDDKWGIIPDPQNVSPHVKAMVESLDTSVGRIMQTLRDRKLIESTVVIFTSDNGGYLTYGRNFRNISSNGNLRGQKTQNYEGGHRVPTIVSWPGKIATGVTAQTTHSTDLLPTLTNLAGGNLDMVNTDGQDLTNLMLHNSPLPDRMLFWRMSTDRAVRSGPWKLCVTEDRTELFNLTDDISEKHNVATKHPSITKQLLKAWKEWEADVNKSAQAYEG